MMIKKSDDVIIRRVIGLFVVFDTHLENESFEADLMKKLVVIQLKRIWLF